MVVLLSIGGICMGEIESDNKSDDCGYNYKSNELENCDAKIHLKENDEFTELEKNNRGIKMYIFGLLILVTQYMFSRYTQDNNDSFGIMFALFSLIDIFIYPVVIAAGIVIITLMKRNLKQDYVVFESIIAWILISAINGIIPLFVFGSINDIDFKINSSLYVLYFNENLFISIIGSVILRLYVINQARSK